MPNVNPAIDALTKTPGALASFFSSFNASFSGGATGAGLFDSLLAETHTDIPPPVTTNATTNMPSSTNVSSTTIASPPDSSQSLSAMQDVISAWRSFIQKWQDNNKGVDHSDTKA